MTGPTRRPAEVLDAASEALGACPNLRSVDGPWHVATPSRAHRCALLAAGRPTLERQRLHCLGPAHVECPTWLEEHAPGSIATRPGPFVTAAPVVLEGPGLGLPRGSGARHLARPATVVVLVIVVGAYLLARGPLAPTPGGGEGSASPGPTPGASTATAAPISPAPATAAPTPTPAAIATPVPTATPRPKTYRVKRGDTLTSIAAQFGTTARELAELNGITDPSLIRVGQRLRIP